MSAGIKANVDGSAAIQVGGTDVITLTSGGAATFVTSPTTVQAGTAAAPSITFSGDTNTGIYSPGADQVAIATGGSQRTVVDASGTLNTNVGGVEGIQIATDLNNSAISSRLLFTTSTNTIALFNASGELYFNTGTVKGSSSGTTRVVLNSNGIGLGGTSANSGTGIRFPAAQSASSDANTLDDYEEGTWTPTDTSGAGLTFGAITSARYVKIGKRVFCDLEVLFPTTANTASISIGGLPYTSENVGDYGTSSCMNDANLNLWAFVGTNQTNVTIYKQAATYTLAKNNEVSAKTLYISIMYNAAS